MNPIDFKNKPKSFKLKGVNMLGNSLELKKVISYNNEERKNYYKNLIPKQADDNTNRKNYFSNQDINNNKLVSQSNSKKLSSSASRNKIKLNSNKLESTRIKLNPRKIG